MIKSNQLAFALEEDIMNIEQTMRVKYDFKHFENGDAGLKCRDCGMEYRIPKADLEMIKKERIIIVCDNCTDGDTKH